MRVATFYDLLGIPEIRAAWAEVLKTKIVRKPIAKHQFLSYAEACDVNRKYRLERAKRPVRFMSFEEARSAVRAYATKEE